MQRVAAADAPKRGGGIIGREVAPFDNSYCIKISGPYGKDGEDSYLIPGHWATNGREQSARFYAVSVPYSEVVHSIGLSPKSMTFINVQSSVTGNIYRTLFDERMWR